MYRNLCILHLYICRNMVNTKSTHRKSEETYRCSGCGDKFGTLNQWSDHIVKCCEEKREAAVHVCLEPACTYTATHARDLMRHTKKKQPAVTTICGSESETDEMDASPETSILASSSKFSTPTSTTTLNSNPDMAPIRKATRP